MLRGMSDKEKTEKEKRMRNPVALIREVAALFQGTDLTEIEVTHDDLRVRVARQITVAAAAAPVAAYVPAAPTVAAAAPSTTADAPSNNALLSPMVGTAYTASEPGAPPFVQVGDTVSAGQTVMIIEAMKVMNNIPAPRAGKVTKIYVSDKQSVEYNQPLLEIV
jgi:acetyl-CoA carboxylase biotin carboxyl carrier protein